MTRRRGSLVAVLAAVGLGCPTGALAAGTAVDLGATYTSDSFANLAGGLSTGFRQMGLLELVAEADLARVGLDGAHAFVNVQVAHGQSLSGELVGDAQILSNIDAPDAVRLFEAWVRVPLTSKAYVKAGLIDLNSEFDVQTFGSLFLNSSHGISPDFSQSGANGPSIFPVTATAVMLHWSDENRWSARIGLFDAVAGQRDDPRRTAIRFPGSSGLLIVAEADVALTRAVDLQLGGWHYTSRFDELAPTPGGGVARSRGNRGAYAMVETRLGKIAARPLGAWFRVGAAASHVNPIEFYTGGGLTLGKEGNRVGLAFASAKLGRPARRVAPRNQAMRETVIELTYERAINDRLTVQPDVQYVVNPGWDRALDNALVAGVRLIVTL